MKYNPNNLTYKGSYRFQNPPVFCLPACLHPLILGTWVQFINQARTGRRLAWFLEIYLVYEVCVGVYVCVCVSATKASVMWRDVDPI